MSGLALEAELTAEVGGGASRFEVRSRLRLEAGVLVLFGPSGSGKSTTLRSLAGLVRPAQGFVRVGGRVLFDAAQGVDVPPHRRGLAYVPQHDTLFPFCDVRQNVAFGLRFRERLNAGARVEELLEELELAHLAHAAPASLSGGERQRVALARALILRPRLLLLDEPFAAVDDAGRQRLRQTLRRALSRYATSAVLVTHDVEEAKALGDELVCFERGRTTLQGRPEALLRPLAQPG